LVNQNGWKNKSAFLTKRLTILGNKPSSVYKWAGQAPAKPKLFGLAVAIIILVTYAIASGHLPTTQKAYADSAKVVSLYSDGQKRIFTTDATTVGEVLARTNIKLGPHDLVEPAANTQIPAGFFNINVYRARPVLVVDGADKTMVNTAYASPHLVAQAAGIKTYPEDDYTDTYVTNFVGDGAVGEKVTVIPAKPITLSVDGTTKTVRTQAPTVGQFLAGANIKMGKEDTTSMPLDAPVLPGDDLTVTRVSDVTVTQHEVLPYATKTDKDPDLYVGQSQTTQAGVNGGRDVTYHIRYNDGTEVERDILNVANLVNPVSQIVQVGTKVRFAGSIEYWRADVQAAAAANGVDPNLMLAIMSCESNGNAAASNGTHFGLYQYDMTTWAGVGGTSSNIYDGPTQITKTAWKIANYGTSPWNASKSCWANY